MENTLLATRGLMAAKGEGEFSRIEDKFVLPLSAYDLVENILHQELRPHYLGPDTSYTLIESTYFDGDALPFYQHHLEGRPSRFKLRLRRYGPDGVWSEGPVLLEIKKKKLGVSRKVRFALSQDMVSDLMEGKVIALTEELASLNRNLKPQTLVKRLAKANDLIRNYELRPSLKATYLRKAFERDGIRATMDRDLKMENLNELSTNFRASTLAEHSWQKALEIGQKYSPANNFIFELKHPLCIPPWASKLFEQLGVEKTGFSKYCWGQTQRFKQGES